MICIGITGYLGSGKSTALSFFKDFDFLILDSDKIVHSLYEPGKDGWRKIKDFFGTEFLEKGKGPVNRGKLGKVVFDTPVKLRILEKIIHPLVYNEIQKKIQKNKNRNIAIEAIKFNENRLGRQIDYFVEVQADIDIAYKRFSKKRTLSFDSYKKIITMQELPKKPDFIIENNRSKKDLKANMHKIIKRMISQNN